MSADWGLFSSLSTTGPLRSVCQCRSGALSALSVWSQRCLSRPSCSVSFPRATAMKEDSQQGEEIVLDRGIFKQQLHLRALRVPKQHSHFVSKALSRFTLERPKLKHIIHDPACSESRLVLLAENVTEADVPEEKLAEIERILPVEIVPHDIDLDYGYYSVEQVLKEILPEGWKVPASFETVGHIAHLNLTDELLPYRNIIAEVFLDKNQPKIKTIVNKVGTISNEFRVPTWEVLAGDSNLVTEVKQHNATFRLDFGLVYWNSRLEFEHKRLSSHFQPGQVILDMFAGIGPFAIPAAQKGCVVFANDLNPASVQYLEVNAKINKVEGNIHAYNMDAREFVRNLQRREDLQFRCLPQVAAKGYNGSSVKDFILAEVDSDRTSPLKHGATTIEGKKNLQEKKGRTGKGLQATSRVKFEAKPWELFHHVVMNLPASALEFLDVFQGLLSKNTWRGAMPQIHCYCFMRASETTSDVVKHAESILGGDIKDHDVWTVRDVAPNKIMLCLSFHLPEHIAFGDLSLPEDRPTFFEGDVQELEQESTLSQIAHLQNKRLRTES